MYAARANNRPDGHRQEQATHFHNDVARPKVQLINFTNMLYINNGNCMPGTPP